MEMQREGVVHASIGAHRADEGAMVESVVTPARRETPWMPPKPAAVRAATARKNALPVAVVDLPCGPGAFTEAVVELPVEADPQGRSLHGATAYLPFPDGRDLAVLTLTTTAVGAREHYRDIHRGMARMMSSDLDRQERHHALHLRRPRTSGQTSLTPLRRPAGQRVHLLGASGQAGSGGRGLVRG
ncbi:hypothetical protein [Streptomyces sp. CRN 30]|uniref:hypothetical protein n=1 Tax=Streptomyces sp. CRN 30 TaxID=3075613 RepID=UPI002A825CEB|nr:hypothetical protein [Streptomyces sp. CRN 30]